MGIEHKKVKFYQITQYKRFIHNGVYFIKLTNSLAANISNGDIATVGSNVSCRIAYDKKLKISKV